MDFIKKGQSYRYDCPLLRIKQMYSHGKTYFLRRSNNPPSPRIASVAGSGVSTTLSNRAVPPSPQVPNIDLTVTVPAGAKPLIL